MRGRRGGRVRRPAESGAGQAGERRSGVRHGECGPGGAREQRKERGEGWKGKRKRKMEKRKEKGKKKKKRGGEKEKGGDASAPTAAIGRA